MQKLKVHPQTQKMFYYKVKKLDGSPLVIALSWNK